MMSFIGCVENLMPNRGSDEIMKAAFASVDKLLSGSKYFPQTVRALRMVVEALLAPHIHSLNNSEEQECFLDHISKERKTSKS